MAQASSWYLLGPFSVTNFFTTDQWRLTTTPAMRVGATPHARHLWEGSIQDPSAGTKLQIPLCFQGIWLGLFPFAFCVQGLEGDMLSRFCSPLSRGIC
jgi:hypothetical protein